MNRRVWRVTGALLAGVLMMGDPAVSIYATPYAGISAMTVPQSNTVKGGPAAGVSLAVSDYLASNSTSAAQVSENHAPVVLAEENAVPAATEENAAPAATEENVPPVAVDESILEAGTVTTEAGQDAQTEQVITGETLDQTVTADQVVPVQPAEQPVSEYADIAIAQVDNYVNVRSEPSTESEVLGKLYNNSAAKILETTADGWYRITSGSVDGYVKCEYVVAGDEELARSVSTRYAKVTTTTLFVRTEPSTDASVLGMVPLGDDLVVLDESTPGWAKVTVEEGEGYVSTDYVTLTTEFVQAESKAEEEARLAKEEAERQAAAAAAAAARKKDAAAQSSGDSGSQEAQQSYAAPASSNGQAVANYACQFVGNPYVYGGSSLTNGTDCSGFVMSVYAAFGIGLPHSSSALRGCGYEVSLSSAQPGDIVCYSGHVGIYIGNGTIVHASTPSSGITYSSVNYRSPICVRRIF